MTGCIIAVKGIPQDDGKFCVLDFCWPTPSPTSKILTTRSSGDDRFSIFFNINLIIYIINKFVQLDLF